MKIAILGCTGMLGSMLLSYLTLNSENDIVAISRTKLNTNGNSEGGFLDAEASSTDDILNAIRGCSWAINAIGVIKPYIHDDNPLEAEKAIRVNSLFPHLIAKAAEKEHCRVIQIATDCVFSGQKGRYLETDPQDPFDVYGKSKSLGEVFSPNVHHLRCSIIGPEKARGVSLLNWFLGQSANSEINGFTNHYWNGVTTLHFAKICKAIMEDELQLPHVQHLLPKDILSKYELLKSFAVNFDRTDLEIRRSEAKSSIDRTLSTIDADLNRKLWQAAGYSDPPTINSMITELSQFNYQDNAEGQ